MEEHDVNIQKKVKYGDFYGYPEDVGCPIDKSHTGRKLIFRRTDNVGIWKCHHCDIMFASPRFTEDSLLKIYESVNFIGDKSLYENWSYKDWEARNAGNTYLAQQLKINLINKFLTRKDKILDFGCGTGLLCLEASKQGFNMDGIDASSMLTDIGKNILRIPLYNGHIENFFPSYKYKGIVAWAVLEHVYDLKSIVGRCNKLLESGGFLFVDVPNHQGLSNRYKTFLCQQGVRKCDFKHFGFPWHIYSFNKKSLTVLMDNCGFKPILFEFWSHLYKQGVNGIFSNIIISLTRKLELSDYITLVAQKK